jgi:hypothetical protein
MQKLINKCTELYTSLFTDGSYMFRHRVNKEVYNLVHLLVTFYILDNARYKNQNRNKYISYL